MTFGKAFAIAMGLAFILVTILVSTAEAKDYTLYSIHCYGDGKLLYVNRTIVHWQGDATVMVVTENSGKKHLIYNMACIISPFKRHRGGGE